MAARATARFRRGRISASSDHPRGRQHAQQRRAKDHQVEVVEVFGRIQHEEIAAKQRQRDDGEAVEQPQHHHQRGKPDAEPGEMQPRIGQGRHPAEAGIGKVEIRRNPVAPDPVIPDEAPAVPGQQGAEEDAEDGERLRRNGL